MSRFTIYVVRIAQQNDLFMNSKESNCFKKGAQRNIASQDNRKRQRALITKPWQELEKPMY